VAATCTTISFLPQAIKTLRERDTRSLSLGMYVIFTFGVVMWSIYGYARGDWVIVVGNINVGGTGKTPLVIWLAGRLAALGLPVAVVSRGYGRRGHRDVVQLLAGSSADEVGDEPLVIARRAQCPVYVGSDRVRAAQAAIAGGAAVVIADDGLQHLRLARDAEVALADTQRGFGNGALLPAGPLRELPARLDTVSALVWSVESFGPEAGERREQQQWPGLRMLLAGSELRAVGASGRSGELASLAGQPVHAVAGIGNPRRFFASLRAAGLGGQGHRFSILAELRRLRSSRRAIITSSCSGVRARTTTQLTESIT